MCTEILTGHVYRLVAQEALEAEGYSAKVEKTVATFGELLATGGSEGIKEFLSMDQSLCQLFKMIGKSPCLVCYSQW